jgi:signal transduction histidine kinase/DNA-binding response OmpR family regulator
MNFFPQIRVVFGLAFLAGPVLAAGFGPLITSLPLPEALRGRPIWHAVQLPEGELAVGFEGGLALGFPGGAWRTVPAPDGQTVKVVAAGHGRLLVAGLGFCGFLEGAALSRIQGLDGEYIGAASVPDGWLVAGSDGVWLVSPVGTVRNVARPRLEFTGTQSRLVRLGGEYVVSARGERPRLWRGGRLVDDPQLGGFGEAYLHSADGEVCLSTLGITDRRGRLVPADQAKEAALRAGGIVGVVDDGPLILIASFNGGVAAVERDTGRERWTWREGGDIFGLTRTRDGLLVATATGVYSMADPSTVGFFPFRNVLLFELIAGGGSEVTAITGSGRFRVADSEAVNLAESWPRQGEVVVEDRDLRFGSAVTTLRNRFVTGLAVQSDTVGVTLSHELVLLARTGQSTIVPLEGIVGSVGTDGRNFYAATAMRGVHVVSPDGRVLGAIGSGRASVSEVAPGRAVLLFGDGAIRNTAGQLLGRVPDGIPRDTALVAGELAVLVTRPDRDPVIGLVAKRGWQPLELPGLAEVGAEHLAAAESHLFVAGPRGIVRYRLPVKPAEPPRAAWKWSAPEAGREILLREADHGLVYVTAAPGELAPAPVSRFRVRQDGGAWTDLPRGAAHALAVAPGRTRVSLQAERNGLLTETALTMVRPRPWWQSAWVWPLYALALAAAIVGLARWRTRRLERLNRDLEARVAERTIEWRKANAVKEEFLASISHEIRNPLNGVVGICAILADRKVGPQERLLVRTLGGCADQLRSMLDDILDFSRLEREAPTLANADFELVALVEECARVMDPELSACALLLPEEPCWLHGDSGKLRQLACNLISNALKYGEPREAGVEVKLTRADGGRVRVRLAVRNTGPTIPAEEIPRLFESFHRGSGTQGIPGSGLGLAVCRRLANALGGHLTAASADGVTEFALEVVLPSAQPVVRAAVAPAAVSRALAVEDEEYNRMALGHVLRALGYAVDWAESGQAALRLAAANPYDLVLTDWRLGDMEGGELCRRLLEIMPEPRPPVVAVTAYSSDEKLAEARAVGMAGFVTKPVTREKLEGVIRELSGARQPRRSLDILRAEASKDQSALATLGEVAPSPLRLAEEIADGWRSVSTLAGLRDPRTGREAHALRSLLLLAGENSAAEQLALMERAATAGDWETVQHLHPFARDAIQASEARLRR